LRKTILLYGFSLAFLVFLLKVLEYRFFVRDLSVEFYVGASAVLFTVLGAWIGLRLKPGHKVATAVWPSHFSVDLVSLKQTGISKRELEVLELISQGNSNQEIADKLFISLNTVKTHTSSLFVKLDAKRRTQAIQRAKALRLIR
jgi:DNA-binding CsgD family transcriptional regulator